MDSLAAPTSPPIEEDSPPKPVYLIEAEGSVRELVIQELGCKPTEIFSSVAEFAQLGLEPGLVLLGPGLRADQLLVLIAHLGNEGQEWVPICVTEGPQALEGRALSADGAVPVSTLVRRFRDPEEEEPILSMRTVLRIVAKSRHDINNPLTAGLAETQLLLMDVEDPEIREPLEVIETQLRRIRDLVSDLGRIRAR